MLLTVVYMFGKKKSKRLIVVSQGLSGLTDEQIKAKRDGVAEEMKRAGLKDVAFILVDHQTEVRLLR